MPTAESTVRSQDHAVRAAQDNIAAGLLFIGDPHLEARIPGFRKDDYPQVALEKFRWSLRYARQNQLQPILLGDLFQLPQDNPNWLISAIIEAITEELDRPLPAIYGNHDVRENSLKPNDSIHILFSGGHLARLSATTPWMGIVGGRTVRVGGSAWGERLPNRLSTDVTPADLTVWVSHHDILIPGYEESGRIRPRELPGIDLIVNGHVHRRLPPVRKGDTHWITAGNIVRRTRSDASREHRPAVVRLAPTTAIAAPVPTTAAPVPTTDAPASAHDAVASAHDAVVLESRQGQPWKLDWVTVPHRPFDEVFHPELEAEQDDSQHVSGFVADLRELTVRRTDSGAGLNKFLDRNLDQFQPPVAAEIRRLASQVSQPKTSSTK